MDIREENNDATCQHAQSEHVSARDERFESGFCRFEDKVLRYVEGGKMGNLTVTLAVCNA
jgi:hypothetical protein